MKRIVAMTIVVLLSFCSCQGTALASQPLSQQPVSEASDAQAVEQELTPCPYGLHQPWEDYIAQPLIDSVGQAAYDDFASKSIAQGECATIYGFLFEFDVPYETFLALTEKEPRYDIRQITTVSYSWVIENERFIRFFNELQNERRQQLTDAVKERIDSYRNGTFEEMPNHHPAYPEDFPPAKNLPEIKDHHDYDLYLIEQVGMGARSYTGGGIYVVVWVDQTHQIVLDASDFGDIIGFGYSGFHSGDMLFDSSNAVLAEKES